MSSEQEAVIYPTNFENITLSERSLSQNMTEYGPIQMKYPAWGGYGLGGRKTGSDSS